MAVIRTFFDGVDRLSRVARQVENSIRGTKRASEGATTAGASMGATFTKVGVAAVAAGVAMRGFVAAFRPIIETASQFEAYAQTFRFATGSITESAQQIEFVKDVAKEYGLEIKALVGGYSQLLAATNLIGFSLDTTQTLFKGISAAAATLNLSVSDTRLIMVALTQIASKGAVSMEELRRQLGERVPGVFKIAADAMGLTTDALIELVSSGNLASEDFLGPFGEQLVEVFGPTAAENIDRITGKVNLLSTATTELALETDKLFRISEKYKGLLSGITTSANALSSVFAVLNKDRIDSLDEILQREKELKELQKRDPDALSDEDLRDLSDFEALHERAELLSQRSLQNLKQSQNAINMAAERARDESYVDFSRYYDLLREAYTYELAQIKRVNRLRAEGRRRPATPDNITPVETDAIHDRIQAQLQSITAQEESVRLLQFYSEQDQELLRTERTLLEVAEAKVAAQRRARDERIATLFVLRREGEITGEQYRQALDQIRGVEDAEKTLRDLAVDRLESMRRRRAEEQAFLFLLREEGEISSEEYRIRLNALKDIERTQSEINEQRLREADEQLEAEISYQDFLLQRGRIDEEEHRKRIERLRGLEVEQNRHLEQLRAEIDLRLALGEITAQQAAILSERAERLASEDPIVRARALEEVGREAQAQQFSTDLARTFIDGILEGEGVLRSFFGSLADNFTQRMVDNLIDSLSRGLFDNIFGGAGGGGGLLGGLGFFGGGRQRGGPVSAGLGYLIGEDGPELFIPRFDGRILNRQQAGFMGRGGQSPTIVIHDTFMGIPDESVITSVRRERRELTKLVQGQLYERRALGRG